MIRERRTVVLGLIRKHTSSCQACFRTQVIRSTPITSFSSHKVSCIPSVEIRGAGLRGITSNAMSIMHVGQFTSVVRLRSVYKADGVGPTSVESSSSSPHWPGQTSSSSASSSSTS